MSILTYIDRGDVRCLPPGSRLSDRSARPVVPFGWTARRRVAALAWDVGPVWVFWYRDAKAFVRSLPYRYRHWQVMRLVENGGWDD